MSNEINEEVDQEMIEAFKAYDREYRLWFDTHNFYGLTRREAEHFTRSLLTNPQSLHNKTSDSLQLRKTKVAVSVWMIKMPKPKQVN